MFCYWIWDEFIDIFFTNIIKFLAWASIVLHAICFIPFIWGSLCNVCLPFHSILVLVVLDLYTEDESHLWITPGWIGVFKTIRDGISQMLTIPLFFNLMNKQVNHKQQWMHQHFPKQVIQCKWNNTPQTWYI